MQDYIPREIDINGRIENVVVKQYDNNSRYLHVTISDADLTDGTFELTGCSTALYIKPEGSEDDSGVSFVSGEIADADEGIVTFLLPGGVTQNVGRYECEIWIYQGDETTRPVISTKPFTLVVEKSIKNDSAIVATQSMSALDAKMVDIQAVKNQMAALAAMADAGEIPAGTVEAEVADARVGKGATYSSLGSAVRASVQGVNTYLNAMHWGDSPYNNDFDNLPNNIIVPCGIDNTNEPVAHAPITTGGMTGLIITFGRDSTRKNGDTQLWIPWHGGEMKYRQYNVTEGAGSTAAWSSWVTGNEYLSTSLTNLLESRASSIETIISELPQYRSGINSNHASYDEKLSHCKIDGTFIATHTRTENGSEVVCWTDLPNSIIEDEGFVITNSRYSNYILQRAVGVESGAVYNRVLHKDSTDDDGYGLNKAVYHNWICENPDVFRNKMKILAVGDSICKGYRNGEKGFVGDLGLPYNNYGISATTLSNVIDGTVDGKDRTCIPKQLKRVHDNTPNYKPDIIIGEGGINDYFQSAVLGTVPIAPVTNDTELNALDESTVMGGLQKLLYYMIALYPEAQRFFLITHKTSSQYPTSTFNYLPVTRNSAGYTQQDLHDAIVACCKVYNVKVIDVFEDSMINSAFTQYRSPTAYSSANPGATASEYVDYDGVHPLARGYLEGYVPLIREAIRTDTVKN